MWISKREFTRLMEIVDQQATEIREIRSFNSQAVGFREALLSQKAKDDITIDWMRHRVNALEKQNAVLLNKAAGVIVPVPEIVPTRPGTMSVPPEFESMPSFEDVGDHEAKRLGVGHDKDGNVVFGMPEGK